MVEKANPGMSGRAQVTVWFVAILVFAILLYVLRGVLLPFVAGMAVAYFLDPVADRLEAMKMPRVVATSIITAVFFALVILFLLLLVPTLQQQVVALARQIPAFIDAARDFLIRIEVLEFVASRTAAAGSGGGNLERLFGELFSWLGNILGSAWAGGIAILNFLSLIFITPIVAFYLLLDWDRIVDKIDSWLPRDHVGTIRALARDADRVLAGFVRGQGTVCMLLAVFYAAGLSIVGLNFGLVVGVLAGLLSFVPFLGAGLGFIAAGGLALYQFWPDPVLIGAVFAIFVSGQVIEGNFLTPRLVGRSIGLHPLWVIFALLAFGAVFGFLGVLLAIPISAVVGVLMRYFIGLYLKSPLYYGATGGTDLE